MIIWSLAVIAAIFFGDLWIKNKIESCVGDKESLSKAGGRVLIRKHHNRGAIFNWGEGFRPEKGWGRKAVAALSLLLCVVLSAVFVFSFTKGGSRLLRAGLSLLLGGAFSNTYDRLKRKYVVDYLSFQTGWGCLDRIVFNASDFCIMLGAVLTAIGFGTDKSI